MESPLESLYNIYRTGRASSDVAYWLVAGKYVTGQIDIARDLAAGARERYPDDSMLAVVEALIAYTDGDYGRSVSLLRGILEKAPDDPVAGLDLAIVLAGQGDHGEARAILEHVQNRRAGTALASRAESILSDMENRQAYPDRNPVFGRPAGRSRGTWNRLTGIRPAGSRGSTRSPQNRRYGYFRPRKDSVYRNFNYFFSTTFPDAVLMRISGVSPFF